MDRTQIQTSIKHWRIALLALLGIAASQLVLAGHQLAHDETVVAENCTVCIQLEQLDSPTVGAGSASSMAIAKPVLPVFTDRVVADDIICRYSSRAPPAI